MQRTMTMMGICGALAACADGEARQETRQVAVVQGQLAADSQAEAGTSVTVGAIDDDGAARVAAHGTLTASGSFRLEVPPGQGPFVVTIGGGSSVVAEGIVAGDLAGGDQVTVDPLGLESTVEAAALVTILAGEAQRDDVDGEALMTWVDLRLATTVQSGATTAGAIGGAFMAAVEAEVGATARGASEADAIAAAGVIFEAALSGSAEASFEASRIAAVLMAEADLAAQLAAIAGSSGEATIRSELEAAFDAWFSAAAEARDDEELGTAWEDLMVSLTASGDSVLELVAAAEGDDADEAREAIAATAEIAAELETRLSQALAGAASARVDAVAQAYADFSSEIATSLEGAAQLSTRLHAWAEATAGQLGGHGAAVIEVDLAAMFEGLVGVVTLGEAEVEAAVQVELATRGVAGIGAVVEALIDASVAAETDDDEGVSALSLAVEAAAAAQATIEGAGQGAERAWLEASLVYVAVVEATSGADSELAFVSEVRARIEGALALETAVGEAFEGSSYAGARGELSAAVDAFIAAAGDASTEIALEAASEAFLLALIEIGGEGGTLGGLGLTGFDAAAFEVLVSGAIAAGVSYHASVHAAVASAVGASGEGGEGFDAQALAEVVAVASATFDAAIDVSSLALVGADADAVTTLVTFIGLGLSDGSAQD